MKSMLAAVMMTGLAGAAVAETPARPIVVELFTSEGCSSCPPADALLTELAARPDILPLAFHVTYWNSLGWRDPFSFDGATARQLSYRGISADGSVYTPQMVIDGAHDVVGSDRAGVQAALRSTPADGVALRATRSEAGIDIALGAFAGAGRVWLVGFDAQHRTQVGRGENAGHTLVESNVVRSLEQIGTWNGSAQTWQHAWPAGERAAVLVQEADGRMVGAAVVR